MWTFSPVRLVKRTDWPHQDDTFTRWSSSSAWAGAARVSIPATSVMAAARIGRTRKGTVREVMAAHLPRGSSNRRPGGIGLNMVRTNHPLVMHVADVIHVTE